MDFIISFSASTVVSRGILTPDTRGGSGVLSGAPRRCDVRSELTRSAGAPHTAADDDADLAAKAANFLRVMTAEKCGHFIFRR
jgi:hypothetical protein